MTYNIVDLKPAKMEDLGEVITCANFHSSDSSLLCYGGSSGTSKVIDLRLASQGQNSTREFIDRPDPAKRNFFTDIVNTLSDVKFSLDGKFVYTRDYLTVRVWDMAMEAKPYNTLEVQDEMKRHMCELYEEEKVLEKFELAAGNGPLLVSGAYSSSIMLIGRDGSKSTIVARHENPMDVLPNGMEEWDSSRSV